MGGGRADREAHFPALLPPTPQRLPQSRLHHWMPCIAVQLLYCCRHLALRQALGYQHPYPPTFLNSDVVEAHFGAGWAGDLRGSAFLSAEPPRESKEARTRPNPLKAVWQSWVCRHCSKHHLQAALWRVKTRGMRSE